VAVAHMTQNLQKVALHRARSAAAARGGEEWALQAADRRRGAPALLHPSPRYSPPPDPRQVFCDASGSREQHRQVAPSQCVPTIFLRRSSRCPWMLAHLRSQLCYQTLDPVHIQQPRRHGASDAKRFLADKPSARPPRRWSLSPCDSESGVDCESWCGRSDCARIDPWAGMQWRGAEVLFAFRWVLLQAPARSRWRRGRGGAARAARWAHAPSRCRYMCV